MRGLAVSAAAQSCVLFAIVGAAVFGAAGTLRFWQGWAYVAVFVAAAAAITTYLARRDPALLERRLALARRGEPSPSQRRFQQLAFAAFLALLIVPGLDRRLGWSSVPDPVTVAGLVAVAAGFAAVWAVFRANSYASSVVEVASDQRVIDTGPYAIVRHPMYAGAFVLIAATPLALGSYWGELAAAPLVAAIVARLLDEERVLAAQLPGYREYLARTRYRLVPKVW